MTTLVKVQRVLGKDNIFHGLHSAFLGIDQGWEIRDLRPDQITRNIKALEADVLIQHLFFLLGSTKIVELYQT